MHQRALATLAERLLACVPFWYNGNNLLAHPLWHLLSLSAFHQYNHSLYCRLGLFCNYGLTTYFTFKGKPSKSNVAGFAGSHVLNYLLEIGLLQLFLWLGASKWLSPILVMVIVVPINFVLLRLVFVKGKKESDNLVK